eukprot:scaffold13511_cov132-Isochrysis_galbana.AAC.2
MAWSRARMAIACSSHARTPAASGSRNSARTAASPRATPRPLAAPRASRMGPGSMPCASQTPSSFRSLTACNRPPGWAEAAADEAWAASISRSHTWVSAAAEGWASKPVP